MQPSEPGKPYWWQWPTIASLDAPAVTLAWQELISRSAGISLSWPHRLILGASVWLAYAADRWIEGWRLAPESIRTQRHHFYQHARWPIAFVWLLVLVADVGVAITELSEREFRVGLLLLVPVLAYLLSHQFAHRHLPWRAPKELCVAVLLAGGVGIFPAAQPGSGNPSEFAISLGFFATLCFANCALISTWEHEVDRTHGQTSLALRYRRAAKWSRALPWLIAVFAVAHGILTFGPIRTIAGCTFVSALLLGAIDRLERRTHWQLARVLADAALLTPLVPLLRARWP